jgi:23S rRNA (guanosine2251-2'-O)-methyltransferase
MKNKSRKIPKRQQNSIFWVYGYHATVAALRNINRRKNELLLTTDAQKKIIQEKDLNILSEIKQKILTRVEIDNLVGKNINHQGICLSVEKIQKKTIKEFISEQDENNSTLVLLDQLEDSQNVGAIFRSALAFNINGIILTENQSVNENGFIAKSACGGLDKVPFTYISNLSSSIKTLKENGYWVYGLDGKAKKLISEIDFPKKTVLVLGSESDGMRKITASLCDELVKIKISDELESLNVSNTAAVAFYHLSRTVL